MKLNLDKPASPKQLKWLRDLLNQRSLVNFAEGTHRDRALAIAKAFDDIDKQGYEPVAVNIHLRTIGQKPITMSGFRYMLAKLQDAPIKVQSEKAEPMPQLENMHQVGDDVYIKPVVLEDGMYKVGDTFYKVKHSQNNKQWAHKLYLTKHGDGTATGSFRYAGKPATFGIAPEHALSYEDAKEFGALYNMCVCCGRLLTNELSVVLGIGPVCGKRQFGGTFKHMLDEATLKIEAATKAVSA
jgi:hypothetical protein